MSFVPSRAPIRLMIGKPDMCGGSQFPFQEIEVLMDTCFNSWFCMDHRRNITLKLCHWSSLSSGTAGWSRSKTAFGWTTQWNEFSWRSTQTNRRENSVTTRKGSPSGGKDCRLWAGSRRDIRRCLAFGGNVTARRDCSDCDLFYRPRWNDRARRNSLFKRAFHQKETECIFCSSVDQVRPREVENIIEECLQPLGKVETRRGRLVLVFPNRHVRKVTQLESISNEEGGKKKKRRITAFLLINPDWSSRTLQQSS